MWRYYLQKVLYSVKAGRLFLFLCDYVHINIYINSLKLTNVTIAIHVVTYDNAPFVISRYVSSVLPRFSKGQGAI